jgi:hypothetical protein
LAVNEARKFHELSWKSYQLSNEPLRGIGAKFIGNGREGGEISRFKEKGSVCVGERWVNWMQCFDWSNEFG